MTAGKIVVRTSNGTQPSPFPWGEIRWLYHSHLAADAEMTFGVVTIRAGEHNPAHSHANCEELLYLLQGELDHHVDEDVYHLTPGTLIRLPRNTKHHAISVGEQDAVMVVCYSSAVRQTAVHGAGQD